MWNIYLYGYGWKERRKSIRRALFNCYNYWVVVCGFVFFFSSRRRHTRSKRDWSSDVCSSDLIREIYLSDIGFAAGTAQTLHKYLIRIVVNCLPSAGWHACKELSDAVGYAKFARSEERRVGKECRTRCGGDEEKKEK